MNVQFDSLRYDLWANRACAGLLAFFDNSTRPGQEAGGNSGLEPEPRIPAGTQMKVRLRALE
jgi:hypothetical protein